MAITKLNSLAIPANTVVAADLSYPLTNFSSTGIDDNADATAITISSAEDVGIGGTPNNYSDYVTLTMDAAQGGAIDIEKDGTVNLELWTYRNTNDVAFAAPHASGNIRFMAGGFNERARILSSGGITFNGDTAAANALDDYEEGTWTPTITNGVNSISYGNRSGHYTKVGNLVFLDFYIYYSGTGSGAQYLISGLPFSQKNVNYCRGGGCSTYQNYGGKVVTFYGNQGTSYIYCYKDGSTSFTSSGTVGNYLIGTFTYQTD